MREPDAYRLEWKPGDYCYYSRDGFARETRRDGARVCGLFLSPQPGCQAEPAVFHGGHWIEPKHAKGAACPEGFVPLYLGPVINEPAMDENVLFAFPALTEPVTAQAYCLGTGTMDRCKTCKHEDTWKSLKPLDTLRLAMQSRMVRISDDECRLTKGGHYAPMSAAFTKKAAR